MAPHPMRPWRSIERKTERQLVRDYETLLGELIAKLAPENHHLAVGLDMRAIAVTYV